MQEKAQMTGPEHFRAGEHALERAGEIDLTDGPMAQVHHAAAIAEAQAHFAAAEAACYGALVADADQDGVSQGWQALLDIKVDDE